ncbi:glycoside hydrolase family 43 protein [Asticcacaulis sp. SL142]|uniref:glycoside hydrolase family 43 protein n=1 Tax=Asticcacaulis sp. SL142 TaxID=2995155 RepID=UPI003B637A26
MTLNLRSLTVSAVAILCGATSALAGDARFAFFEYSGTRQESAIAKPAVNEYINPILSGYYPDPSITRVGDDYYLVNSSFAHYPGLPVFHSKDLVNWTQIANAINRPSQLNFDNLGTSRGVFAPDISHHDGTFYIVNTCVDCGGNFVITATDPKGPWSEPVWFEFEGIDPSIFWDKDGKAYIVNNGAPNEPPRYDGHRAIWVQEFDPKTLKMVGPRTQIVNGGVDITQKPSWIEGPHLINKDGYYYLTAAEGGTGDQHSQVVFRAPAITGPFVPFEGNPILSQRTLDPARANPVTSAGHAKLVQTQNGDWWATFLATRPYGPDLYNIGRETFLLPVKWENGWPMILEGGKRIPFTAAKPNLPAGPKPAVPMNGDFGYKDEFDALSMAWVGIRTPRTEFYTLDKGELILKPQTEAIGDKKGAPSFLGRRQQHHIATVTTAVTYMPEKDGDRAGLLATQSDDAYLFFGLTQMAGQTVIALNIRQNANDPVAGKRLIMAQIPHKAKSPVYLKITANGGTFDLAYALKKGEWVTIRKGLDATFLSTRKAGGFVGTLIGPYNEAAK